MRGAVKIKGENKMSKEDILAQIEIVLPKLETYIKYKEVSLDKSERDIIQT